MRLTKYLKCTLGGLFFGLAATAQQKPYYTQYILNNYILNPALSGIENYTDLKISYRNQWTGIDGAPVTTYLSIQGPTGENKDEERNTVNSFGKSGVNVRGKRVVEDDISVPAPHSGLGMIMINDKTGYINRFAMYGTYAYHKPLNPSTTLSAGFQLGFSNISLDRSKIVFSDLSTDDPAIGFDNGELKKLVPEIGVGLWLYSSSFFVGASVLNIVPSRVSFVKTGNYGSYLTPHYFASAGYRFWLSDNISMLPSVALQLISPTPIQLHANVKFQYLDKAWIGGSYRSNDQLGGFAAMAGFNVSNVFNVSYAYDVSLNSRLRTYARNTHEIIIGFLLNNRYGELCPKKIW